MKTIKVVAAVIRRKNKIFAIARGCGEFKGKRKFPEGRIEAVKTPQQALVREMHEKI